MQPRAQTAAASGGDFDQQLAGALSESLRRLGMAPGEVNITIRQGTESASARQILITYNAATTTPASTPENVAPQQTPERVNDAAWSPWDGPRDRRDEVPAGGGLVSASGAPVIRLNTAAARNQYDYAGLGAFNPYFTTPSNPLRPGYVAGFENWFRDASIYGGNNGPVPANRLFFASAEGAQEALRLVQQYEPGAQLIEKPWGGGPYSANNTMYYVQLPGEDRLVNAGMLLNDYYHGGGGVTASSDELLSHGLRTG
jgi:hypothetical protein